jgi:flagellar hook assembly protein FlgD
MPFAMRLPGRGRSIPVVAYAVQSYPNPLNPMTTVEYGVPDPGARVTVRIFDVSGRLLRTLVDARQTAGVHQVSWDGRAEDGNRVASGVYPYEVVVGDWRITKKLVVLR